MAFDRREQNREIFEDAMRLCKRNNRLRQATEASKEKQYVVAGEEELTTEEGRRFDDPAKVVVSKKRSLQAAGNKEYESLKVCVHNFASATNPGGGVVNGASAQEDVVILGAFGCGAFQNPPEIVVRAYQNVIPEFFYDFRVIEFAVYCAPHALKNYDEFYKAFGRES